MHSSTASGPSSRITPPDTPAEALRTTASRGGRFVSVTVTITAESRAQLDAIYADLRAHEQVLAAL